MSEPRLGRGYGSFLGAALSLLPFKAIVNDILGRIHAGTLDLAASPQDAVGSKGGDKIPLMNERQQSHVDYFLERITYWRGLGRDETGARMLAARDADLAHPLRTEEEGTEVFDFLFRPESERTAERVTPMTRGGAE